MKKALVQAAWAAVRSKKSFLCTFYHRLKTKIGPKKAIVAVARKLAIFIYSVLRRRQKYYDLGANYIDKNSVSKKIIYYKRKLEQLELSVACSVQ